MVESCVLKALAVKFIDTIEQYPQSTAAFPVQNSLQCSSGPLSVKQHNGSIVWQRVGEMGV